MCRSANHYTSLGPEFAESRQEPENINQKPALKASL